MLPRYITEYIFIFIIDLIKCWLFYTVYQFPSIVQIYKMLGCDSFNLWACIQFMKCLWDVQTVSCQHDGKIRI